MLALVLSSLLASNFNLNDLSMEMSMDTYPYGVDASPMVLMKSGESPTIDSLDATTLYGHYNGVKLEWNEFGMCKCNKPKYDLKYSNLFYNHPDKKEMNEDNK